MSLYWIVDTNLSTIPGMPVVPGHSSAAMPSFRSSFDVSWYAHHEVAGATTISTSSGWSSEMKVKVGIGEVTCVSTGS